MLSEISATHENSRLIHHTRAVLKAANVDAEHELARYVANSGEESAV